MCVSSACCPWAVPAVLAVPCPGPALGSPDSGSSPDSAATSGMQEHIPWLLTAMSLLLQEGQDKIFLIQKLHSVYEQRD